MNKKILSVVFVIAILFSLCACGNQNAVDEALLAELSNYATKRYESYTIQIETANRNGGKITEEHKVTVADGVRNVSSRVEKINPFIVNGNTITAPEDYMTITEETFTVNESESTAFALPVFRFNRESLSNIKVDVESYPYILTADVISASSLMQNNIDGTNFKLEVEYVTGSLYSLELSYKSENGNTVTVTYTFG